MKYLTTFTVMFLWYCAFLLGYARGIKEDGRQELPRLVVVTNPVPVFVLDTARYGEGEILKMAREMEQ